ncbi:hypothetical protein [Bradyrhizobium mercantei]|uniref:hypothetical protein n=1 Tax=Bradyrhizobium mercantei TaxID=1904807 RepID=UPI0009760E9A|nr:hypothetical protein [Bradyrhizobium mercantei]
MKANPKAFALAATIVACATLLSVGWSEQGGVSVSVERAQARVGRPLTPVSVAGVARRQTRRAVYGTAAVGAAAAAGAYGYYHYPSNGQGFVCQPGTYFRGEDGRQHLCQ